MHDCPGDDKKLKGVVTDCRKMFMYSSLHSQLLTHKTPQAVR